MEFLGLFDLGQEVGELLGSVEFGGCDALPQILLGTTVAKLLPKIE